MENVVSAEGFEPSTHALKGSPTQLQTTTCTSSLLHARHNKIKQIRTRHPSGCPEGVRSSADRDDLPPFFYSTNHAQLRAEIGEQVIAGRETSGTDILISDRKR